MVLKIVDGNSEQVAQVRIKNNRSFRIKKNIQFVTALNIIKCALNILKELPTNTSNMIKTKDADPNHV